MILYKLFSIEDDGLFSFIAPGEYKIKYSTQEENIIPGIGAFCSTRPKYLANLHSGYLKPTALWEVSGEPEESPRYVWYDSELVSQNFLTSNPSCYFESYDRLVKKLTLIRQLPLAALLGR